MGLIELKCSGKTANKLKGDWRDFVKNSEITITFHHENKNAMASQGPVVQSIVSLTSSLRA